MRSTRPGPDFPAGSAASCRDLPDILTLPEVAAWLRLSERTLYDLARTRTLPAAQLGGRWLFPRAALERWLLRRAEPPDAPHAAPPSIIAGSHDPLLEWAVRQSGCGLAIRAGGSLDGLDALARGEALAAATHLLDPDTGGFNEAATRDALGPGRAVGVAWAVREQGLIVAPGNPLGLLAAADLARPGLRVAGRQPRAGSHVLLLHLLTEAGLRLAQVAFLPEPAMAEDEVAAAVAQGRAEAGFGVRAAAGALGFVPLLRERFDLVLLRRDFFAPPVQALLRFGRGAACRDRAAVLGGYDVSGLGEVAFA